MTTKFDLNISVEEYIKDQIREAGYLTNGVVTKSDVLDFLKDFGSDVVEILVENSNLPISSVDFILQYKMGCPFTASEIRDFAVTYQLEDEFDTIYNRLLSMVKEGLIMKGTMKLADPTMVKMILQNGYGYSDKLATNSTINDMSKVARAVGTAEVPMKKLTNNNAHAIKQLKNK